MSKDEMLPASDKTMGKAYEEIGRGDAVWQDEAGNWHKHGMVVRFHQHNGTMGIPPERLRSIEVPAEDWEITRSRLPLTDPPSTQHSNKPRVSDPPVEILAAGQSMAGEGIQAPLDYPLDGYSILFESPPCQMFSSLHDPSFLDRSAGIRRRAWLLEHGTWWQRVKAWFGFTS